jgi:cobalt-zinc-cadmium resistance protein CzcA
MRRSGDPGGPGERIRKATVEVGRPVVFGIAIIIAVYLPIFALEGTERKMFVPMAFTVVAAILGSLLIALTLVPALARVFLQAREPPRPASSASAKLPGLTHAPSATRPDHRCAGCAPWGRSSAARDWAEFMPRLDEGSVL